MDGLALQAGMGGVGFSAPEQFPDEVQKILGFASDLGQGEGDGLALLE